MDATSASSGRRYSSLRRTVESHNQKVTASLEVSKPKHHLLVLDGVRAIACLAVLSYHTNLRIRISGVWNPTGGTIKNLFASLYYFGESGVILFFLLSGFLLFLPFAKALLFDGSWPPILRFYLRRIFRIVPGYFVALFLIILFFHSDYFHSGHWADLWALLTFRMDDALSQQVNGPFWTLAVEFQFYMLLPLIAGVFCLFVRRGSLSWRMVKLTCCLLLMLTWGLLSRYWGLSIPSTGTVNFAQNLFLQMKPFVYGDDTGKYFEAFAVGMLLAMLYIYTQNASQGDVWRARFQRWSPWILLTGLGSLGILSILHLHYINLRLDPLGSQTFNYGETQAFELAWQMWQPISYSIGYGFCIYAMLYGTDRLKRPLELPILRWIGLISFSLYMWHLPLLLLYMNAILPQLRGGGKGIAYMGIVAWILFIIIPVSLTLYRWIEMPGMRVGELLIQWIGNVKKKRLTASSGHVPAQGETSAQERISSPVEVEIP